MTREIICDVCGAKRDIINADDYFVLQIPHRNLEEEIDEPLVVDICSVECLHTVVQGVTPDAEPEVTSHPEDPVVVPTHNGRLQPQEHVGRYEGEVTVR
jgi:hypothetical protein